MLLPPGKGKATSHRNCCPVRVLVSDQDTPRRVIPMAPDSEEPPPQALLPSTVGGVSHVCGVHPSRGACPPCRGGAGSPQGVSPPLCDLWGRLPQVSVPSPASPTQSSPHSSLARGSSLSWAQLRSHLLQAGPQQASSSQNQSLPPGGSQHNAPPMALPLIRGIVNPRMLSASVCPLCRV